jgi:hypothetical protein
VARYEGGWTAVPANTFSLPQPNYVSVIPPISIGGLTSWTLAPWNIPNNGGTYKFITLGDGTYLIVNMVFNSSDYTTSMVTELRQGEGVTYPSGLISGYFGNSNIHWETLANGSNSHSGYAIKLSGITSGGLGAGGAFGGGIQPL